MKSFVKSHIALTVLICLIIVVVITISILTVCARSIPEDAPDRVSVGILPTEAQLAAAVKYDRVLIIGVDGAGGFFGDMETPNFDKMFPADSSSITYTGLSQYPTVSAQNWTSMLHGVRYQKHFVDNTISATVPYTYPKYPSVFKAYAKKHKDAHFVSATTWSPINYGSIEWMANMKKLYPKHKFKGDDPMEVEIDKLCCDMYIEALADTDPTIGFIHLDQVDHAGHAAGAPGTGYGDASYRQAILNVDELIGKLYAAYEQKGWLDSTLFILVSDHGHKLEGGGHGGETIEEKNVTLAVRGDKGNIIPGAPAHYVTQDVASIVMYALGEAQPDSWESRVPANIFTTLS